MEKSKALGVALVIPSLTIISLLGVMVIYRQNQAPPTPAVLAQASPIMPAAASADAYAVFNSASRDTQACVVAFVLSPLPEQKAILETARKAKEKGASSLSFEEKAMLLRTPLFTRMVDTGMSMSEDQFKAHMLKPEVQANFQEAMQIIGSDPKLLGPQVRQPD